MFLEDHGACWWRSYYECKTCKQEHDGNGTSYSDGYYGLDYYDDIHKAQNGRNFYI